MNSDGVFDGFMPAISDVTISKSTASITSERGSYKRTLHNNKSSRQRIRFQYSTRRSAETLFFDTKNFDVEHIYGSKTI